jgi:enoyl-CoA hydratase/carnithine racemase
MADSIRFTIDGSLAELTLAAPERRNAIGSQEIKAVKTALSSIPEKLPAFRDSLRGPGILCLAPI